MATSPEAGLGQRSRNNDATGEYRATKYARKLGAGPKKGLRQLTPIPADSPLEHILRALDQDGAVVLRGAVDLDTVARFNEEHTRLLRTVAPQLEAMQEKDDTSTLSVETAQSLADADVDVDESFYKAERQLDAPGSATLPLRLRKTAHGRYDLKSLDRPYLRTHFSTLPALVEPLVVAPIVRTLLQRRMGTPWRVMRVGSLPTLPGAAVGDWHRDIGEGLFGEDFDLKLPDYYFNALIPLERTAGQNGTEIVIRSHRTPSARLGECERVVADAQPGDVVFFNGKCVHRGCENDTADWRSLIYVVYAATFFDQGRDQSTEYWESTTWPAGSFGRPPTGSKL